MKKYRILIAKLIKIVHIRNDNNFELKSKRKKYHFMLIKN